MRVITLDPGRGEDRAAARNLAFHPTGRTLAACVGDPDHFRDVCRYDLAADAALGAVAPDDTTGAVPDEAAPDPAVSRDLELVAVGMLAYDGLPAVAVIDTWSQEQAEFWFHSPAELVTFPALVFAADNSHFTAAVADPDRRGVLLREWNLDALFEDDAADAELDPVRRPAEFPPDEQPAALATDAAGKFVAVGTTLGAVWLVDARREKPPRKLAAVRGPVRSLAFTPTGGALLVVTPHGVTLADARTGGRLGHWPAGHTAAAAAPDGRRVALAGADGVLSVCDGGRAVRYDAGGGPLSGVAFAPDGLTVAAGGPGGRVVIWDVGD